MDFETLLKLKQSHAAWRLLTIDSAPLVLSFLYQAFIRPNARSIRAVDLVAQLEDTLHSLRQAHGAIYPRTAQAYLDDWASGATPYLRKYYPQSGDEPEFDLLPATERAIDWVRSLETPQFVGTESRLLMVFQLLREIVLATETDPQVRIAELERQKAKLDGEIARMQEGLVTPYDATRIKERFLQVEDMARRLLSDFRQVEENFRQLDRQTRERIATSTASKGDLLDVIWGEQDAIASSDQGKTFKAFWSFLMSPARQEELQEMTRKVFDLKEVKALEPDELLPRIKLRLLEAGEKVQRTSATLVEQLRRYLDDQVWLENKRIMEVIHDIERMAIAGRQAPPGARDFMSLDELKPGLELPMSRGLFIPAEKTRVDSLEIVLGEADFDPEALFQQQYVDEAVLKARIRRMLHDHAQVTLTQVVAEHPSSAASARSSSTSASRPRTRRPQSCPIPATP